MRDYVLANQEIGRLHVQMLTTPDAGPPSDADMETLAPLIQRAVGGPELPDYA